MLLLLYIVHTYSTYSSYVSYVHNRNENEHRVIHTTRYNTIIDKILTENTKNQWELEAGSWELGLDRVQKQH